METRSHGRLQEGHRARPVSGRGVHWGRSLGWAGGGLLSYWISVLAQASLEDTG